MIYQYIFISPGGGDGFNLTIQYKQAFKKD